MKQSFEPVQPITLSLSYGIALGGARPDVLLLAHQFPREHRLTHFYKYARGQLIQFFRMAYP